MRGLVTAFGTEVARLCHRLGAEVLRYTPRADLGIEDPQLPRVLIIGDSISGHYLPGVRSRMQGQANVIGESSMTKGVWASMGPRFYRTDTATKGDDLKRRTPTTSSAKASGTGPIAWDCPATLWRALTG